MNIDVSTTTMNSTENDQGSIPSGQLEGDDVSKTFDWAIAQVSGNVMFEENISEETQKEAMDTEINITEVKEQVLKEVEEMKDSEIPVSNVSAADIDSLLVPLEGTKEYSKPEIEKKDETEHLELTAPVIASTDIKAAARAELATMDILVCGVCLQVFHFMEEFQSHKNICDGKAASTSSPEQKTLVWAFLLWKNSEIKRMNGKIEAQTTETSWKLYQQWCKMSDESRKSWIVAGENLMFQINFGIKSFEKKRDSDSAEVRKIISVKKVPQTGEIKEVMKPAGTRQLQEDIENIRIQLEDNIQEKEKKTMPQEEEFVVEKIVSRRFNPRKKQYEYLLKWEGYPSEQNTWEPAENLETCQHLLRAFEESILKQNALKMNKPYEPDYKNYEDEPGPSGINSFGRPVRSSKQKALNQVKAWCGSIKPDDAEMENLKRKGIDSDEDEDSMVKKMRMDKDSDSEDSLSGKVYFTKSGASGVIKRSRGRPPKNKIPNGTGENLAAVLGLESSGDEADGKPKLSALDVLNQKSLSKKVSSLSPANQQVLVANAKGVVKVDPAQVPNLSSGVYIMSNKSGIIKLDSVTPSKALSLKQCAVQEVKTPEPTTPNAGVIMVNKQGSQQKSGIIRKNQLPAVQSPLHAAIQQTPQPARNAGRPQVSPKPSGNIKISNPNTRLLHSGNKTQEPQIKTTPQKTTPVKKPAEDKRVLGAKATRGNGIYRGGRMGRGGLNIPSHPNVSNQVLPETRIITKEEKIEQVNEIKQEKVNARNIKKEEYVQDSMMIKKKIGRPGSIGSMTVSPKKTEEVDESSDSEMVTISGDDGLLYKVSKRDLNNTLLLSGEDGQQCLYVTTSGSAEDGTVLALDPDNLSGLSQVNLINEGEDGQFYVKEEDGEVMSLQIEEPIPAAEGEDDANQLVAQLVSASEPEANGMRKVVLLLPDGNLMMTEVDDEQYKGLELDNLQTATEE